MCFIFVYMLLTIVHSHVKFVCTHSSVQNPGQLNFFYFTYHGTPGVGGSVSGTTTIQTPSGVQHTFPFNSFAYFQTNQQPSLTVDQFREVTRNAKIRSDGSEETMESRYGDFDNFVCYDGNYNQGSVLNGWEQPDQRYTQNIQYHNQLLKTVYVASISDASSGLYLFWTDGTDANLASDCSRIVGACIDGKASASSITVNVVSAGIYCSKSDFPSSAEFSAPSSLQTNSLPGTVIQPDCVPTLPYQTGMVTCMADGTWDSNIMCAANPGCINGAYDSNAANVIGVESFSTQFASCDSFYVSQGTECHVVCDSGFYAPENYVVGCVGHDQWQLKNSGSCLPNSQSNLPSLPVITSVDYDFHRMIVTVNYNFINGVNDAPVHSWRVEADNSDLGPQNRLNTIINLQFLELAIPSNGVAYNLEQICYTVSVENLVGIVSSQVHCVKETATCSPFEELDGMIDTSDSHATSNGRIVLDFEYPKFLSNFEVNMHDPYRYSQSTPNGWVEGFIDVCFGSLWHEFTYNQLQQAVDFQVHGGDIYFAVDCSFAYTATHSFVVDGNTVSWDQLVQRAKDLPFMLHLPETTDITIALSSDQKQLDPELNPLGPVNSAAPTTDFPSRSPSFAPSVIPSMKPSLAPTISDPTIIPSTSPTSMPTTDIPSRSPSISPSSDMPSISPSEIPSISPSSDMPSKSPSGSPSVSPSSDMPSKSPSKTPTVTPSTSPTSDTPTVAPTFMPTTDSPTYIPSTSPSSDMPTLQPSISSPTTSPTPDAQVLANFITEMSQETTQVGQHPLVVVQYITIVKSPWKLGAPSLSGPGVAGYSNFYMIQSSPCKDLGDLVAFYFRNDIFYCQKWRLEFESDQRCTLEERTVQLGYSAIIHGSAVENVNFSWDLKLGYSSAFQCANDLGNFQIALSIEGRSGRSPKFDSPGLAYIDDWYYFRFGASSGAPITSIKIVGFKIATVDGNTICDDCLNIMQQELQISVSNYTPDNFILKLFLHESIFGGLLHATMAFDFQVTMTPTGTRRRLEETDIVREAVTLNLIPVASIADSTSEPTYEPTSNPIYNSNEPMVEGCTNQDASTSFGDRVGEISCVCEYFGETSTIPVNRALGTILMAGKVQAFEQLDVRRATKRKTFYKKFMNIIGTFDHLEGSTANGFKYGKKWRQFCLKWLQKDNRLMSFATKIDNFN